MNTAYEIYTPLVNSLRLSADLPGVNAERSAVLRIAYDEKFKPLGYVVFHPEPFDQDDRTPRFHEKGRFYFSTDLSEVLKILNTAFNDLPGAKDYRKKVD